ncbi:SGNH family hydrolase [Terrarubrum flagellatum]|uniref:SGNH/GDSL hydrolase family protein n=1 Tax=Terrirubrum flagellatum TaxID=2895980 RepID=UPI0031450319
MRFARILKITLALLVIGLTGGPTVIAQMSPLDLVLQEAKQRRAAEDRARRRAAQKPRAVVSAPRRTAPATVIVRDTPEKPKVDPSTFILVLGDSFGEQLANGLDEAFADEPEIAVNRRTRPESGLTRVDYYDWPKTVRDILASDQKISFVVIQLGANDRQPIRDETNQPYEPTTDRWREIYSQRVDAMLQGFAEKHIPVFWVGMPPMQSPRYSTEMMTLNDVLRAASQKAGAKFIDIWEPFVDSENKFSPYGPDLTGQTSKLRANDGVHFTKAGARKEAHFVELELRRLIENRPASTVIAIPAETSPIEKLPLELQPGGIDRAIDRMVMGLPEPVGIPGLQVKPAAGPILSLNKAATSPGGALASLRDARVESDALVLIERVYREGRVGDAKPGRADDFRWPR